MLKSGFPFRIGSTSYIVPADIMTNVQYVKDLIDDVELILFETPGESNLPSPIEIDTLRTLAEISDLSFTIHLPTDKKPGPADNYLTHPFVQSICSTIELCKPLNPYGYVLHLESILAGSSPDDINQWERNCKNICEVILKKSGIPPERISVENLSYPWHWYKSIIDEFKFSLCLDIGHLWVTNKTDWEEQASLMIKNTRIIHLHGVCNEGDHCSLAKSDPVALEQFLKLLNVYNYNHVVSLEVFNERDFTESVACVRNSWGK